MAERPTEGEALERTSTMSLFSREWNNTYWVLQGDLLLLYPNKELYIRNPTQGRKTFKIHAHMSLKDVAMKPYKGFGNLYKFVLEEKLDYGVGVVARFACFKEEDAHAFHDALDASIMDAKIEAGHVTEEGEEERPKHRGK